MCGIAGIVDYSGLLEKQNSIGSMTDILRHRGPDAMQTTSEKLYAFGHTRLSILDLSDCSNQPFTDASGRFHIVFNGEIYNFREIKEKLSHYQFRTSGDTEVLLAAYIEHGPKCLDLLAGIFSFAIWDQEKEELFLARDRFGVKPLYYHRTNNGIVFASEIRSVVAANPSLKSLDERSIAEFLMFQSVGDFDSIYKEIKSLDAGSYAVVSDGDFMISTYWSLFQQKRSAATNIAVVRKNIKRLLEQSIQRRLVSDVPVAAFLSGGIDSAAVVGLMASAAPGNVNTFTIGFEDSDYDESQWAMMVAKKFRTHHQEIILRPEVFLDDLVPALDAMDTPSGDGVNSYIISKAIKKQGITVALSGIGGDELFAGYPFFKKYVKLSRWDLAFRLSRIGRYVLAKAYPARVKASARIKDLLLLRSLRIEELYPMFRRIVPSTMLRDCTRLPVSWETHTITQLRRHAMELRTFPSLSQISIAEYLGYTRNTLLKDIDQMSMAVALEVREPFFDHELVCYILNIPDKLKFPTYPKSLLVESLNGLIPEEIVFRKKQGFVLPWDKWMKTELRGFCQTQLRFLEERSFMRRGPIMKYWELFLKDDHRVRWMDLWVFVVLGYWIRRNNVE